MKEAEVLPYIPRKWEIAVRIGLLMALQASIMVTMFFLVPWLIGGY